MSDLTILSPSEQVAEHLRNEMLRGRWRGMMPGVPALSAELAVDHKAVARAIALLEEEGLLVSQGVGRPRLISLPEGADVPRLRVAIMAFRGPGGGGELMVDMRHQLEESGHTPYFTDKALLDLGMNAGRVARYARKIEADAWVLISASREVLEWFSKQKVPAFALAGRRHGVSIAGTGPDKPSGTAAATRRLIDLGHRRVVSLCRSQLRLPEPGLTQRAFLGEMNQAGIPTGPFNLPNWEETQEGFEEVLDCLFAATPPTALILDEPFLYNAAYHHLSRKGLRVPEDVSLVCTDADPSFEWCRPSVAHIDWNYTPVVRRIVRWANNVARGRRDLRQTMTKAVFVDGGTVGPANSLASSR